MKVNEKIKKIRELKDLSQEQVAEKLGLATSSYSKIERGVTNISLTRLEEIAQIFNINATDLLENSNQVICLISENNSSNYYGTQPEMTAELEKYKLTIQHQNELIEKQAELLEQQKRELAALNEIILLLKEKSTK